MDILTYTLLKSKLGAKADLIDGKIPAEQLPSYVDDVVEYATLADFPEEGEESKIYIALDSGLTYRWSGSQYVQIGGQDLSNYYTKDETNGLLNDKQDTIDDLNTIRSGASAGATAIQQSDLEAYHDSSKQDTINDLVDIRSGAALGETSVQENNSLSDTDIQYIWNPLAKKGDIISFDAKGSGTNNYFRVLKIDGAIAKVLLIDTSNTPWGLFGSDLVTFEDGNSYVDYNNHALDISLNETYYASLSETTKAAIVQTTIVQSAYQYKSQRSKVNNADFYININQWNIGSFTRLSQQTLGNKYVASLDLDDIKEYFNITKGETWNDASNKVLTELYNGTMPFTTWMRTATQGNSEARAMYIGSSGSISDNITGNNSYNGAVTFYIDLSKIDFTVEDN